MHDTLCWHANYQFLKENWIIHHLMLVFDILHVRYNIGMKYDMNLLFRVPRTDIFRLVHVILLYNLSDWESKNLKTESNYT